MVIRKPIIVYLTHHASMGSYAATINTARRKKAMERAGYRVVTYACKPKNFIRDFFQILHLLPHASYINMRIDGSSTLDMFTLLRLFFWNIHIVWEVHAFQDENYDMNYPIPSQFKREAISFRRRLLSFLVDGVIFISKELETLGSSKIIVRKSTVIPNFVIPHEYDHVHGTKYTPVQKTLIRNNQFIVLWGGFGALRWQGLDLIERAAQRIYAIDRSIIFLIISSERWHRFHWFNNILFMESMPRRKFLDFVQIADVCLALYHKPKYTPFYFSPLKILDYMMLKKPVIATGQKSIESIITDNINGLLTTNTVGDVVEKILTVKRNRSFAAQLGRRARQDILSSHSINHATLLYKKLFSML